MSSQKEDELLDIQLERAADDWVKAMDDCIFFIENYCMLKDQKAGRPIPFKLWPAQKDQISIWMGNQLNETLKSRQIGITWLALAFALWHMLKQKYFEGLVVSRKEEAAISALAKLKFMYDHLPSIIRDNLYPVETSNRLLLKLKGVESQMKAESANPEAGRSDTLNMLIMDEAAFMVDAPTIWTAAEPTLEKTGGPAIIISTANGYDKFFQATWAAGKDGQNGFKCNFISWNGDPSRDQSWYDMRYRRAEAQGTEALLKFKQEYPRNDVEAFIVTGHTVFNQEMIADYLNKPEYRFQLGDLTGKGVFYPNDRGMLKIFQKPKAGGQYVIGADIAEGLEKHDWSVAAVYERSTKVQVAEFRAHIDTDLFSNILNSLGRWYNTALLIPEINNMGDSVLNRLQKHLHYPNIYRQVRYDQANNQRIKKLGWKTTVSTKPVMIDALNSLMREREIEPRSKKLFEEMKTFVRLDAGMSSRMGATGKNHDDCVIAHSLAAVVLLEKPLMGTVSKNRAAVYKRTGKYSHKKRGGLDRNKVFKTR